MFTSIIKLIQGREYKAAINELTPLLDEEDEQVVAKAHYMLGYINTCYDYSDKNKRTAKRHLRFNINSDFSHPNAYVLYAKVESDTNVALNYINKGAERFPKDARILVELLKLSPDKEAAIKIIKNSGVKDAQLMGAVISYLIAMGQWGRISRFVLRLENGNSLQENEKNYLDLISAYANLFCDNPDYNQAQALFEKTIKEDIDNYLAYSHYLGIIYTYLKRGNLVKAMEWFDRIPVNDSIYDLDDGLQPLWIDISFEPIYGEVFKVILEAFSQDTKRKIKAAAMYSLYLYNPSEGYGIYRYKKADILTLMRYLKMEFSVEVATAVYNMRCHFGQFEEAYEVLWEVLKRYIDPQENNIFISEILDNASDEEICSLAKNTIAHLQDDEWLTGQFISSIFNSLVEKLHKINQYSLNKKLADELSICDILKSECVFECAYAYAEEEHSRAVTLYEKIIEKEPENSAAINNLGVFYEHAGELERALECFDKASRLKANSEKYRNNSTRIKKLIHEKKKKEILAVSKAISVESLESIGYTDDFCRKLSVGQDVELLGILQRDIRECAIAVVAGQDKMATIMCGSIIEALLMYKLKEQGIEEYDVTEVNKGKDAQKYPIGRMVLNELLYVADKERILNKNGYHLGHYIRDYRNVIHPAKEIRMSEEVNHENVITMWNVFKRLMSDLFP